ncbi:putative ABC transporter ATP-binding protein [Jeotgalibaca dankookensis]|uniref:Putative ABC transporter ATP-binding protein n=1 Tax=Jeotgalibaca dankookensis TaxID=708126 RepID=A0A1S6IPU4_9LACT|nr:ABC transporter ATP-binding protein [Jeotgalibaca dankookensis]AQS53480.1 putative ABC transporter ATP-binding protein [Jeotgalibaca dankookensis]
MLKLAKRISKKAVFGSILFIVIQVFAELNLPNMTSNIINYGIATGDFNYIWRTGAIMLGLTVITILAAIAGVYISASESQKVGRALRSDIFEKVMYLSKDKIDEVGQASLITRSTNDVEQLQFVFMMMLRMLTFAPIMGIGAATLSYVQSPRLARIFFISVPVLIVFLVIIMSAAVPRFKKIQKMTDRLNLIFREGLTGVRVIRAFNKSDYEEKRFKGANFDFMRNNIIAMSITSLLMPVMILVLSSTNIAIVLIGGEYIAVGDMPVGNLVAFISYSSMLLFSFMMLSFMLTMIPQAQVSAKRINEVLAMESTITDGSKTFPTTDFTDESARLTFDDVTYKFHDAEKPVLCDVSFDMQAGETLAIIGGTGSGKSTMANLIMRLYDATTGSVFLNGENVKDLKQYDIRERISYVPQKANLFTGTIRTNMLDGKPDATDEEIWEALEIAQAKDFVEKLDGGLEYQVEQGGSNFSGGQRQRLSIARAIVKKSAVYVFDDSFSALDFKTDAALRYALKEKITDAVVVIIAQRISSVMTADEIIVLDSGRVVGQGSHEELVEENNETYMEIMNSQFREGEGQ